MNPIGPALTQASIFSLAGVIAVIALAVAVYGVYYQRAVIEPRFGRFEPLGDASGTFRAATDRSETEEQTTAELWSNHHQLTVELRGRNSGTGQLHIYEVTLFTSVLDRSKALLSEPIAVAPGESIVKTFTQEISREQSIAGPITGTVEIQTSGGVVTMDVRISTGT